MTGRELSRAFFAECGIPLLDAEFPLLRNRCAAGLLSIGLPAGCGSEVPGWDDAQSRDHDWAPRFVLVLSEEDASAHRDALAAVMEHALPDEFQGFGTVPTECCHIRTPREVLEASLGSEADADRPGFWAEVPELALFEVTCGDLFYEPRPLLTPCLQPFAYYPEEVWRKRLSYCWYALMQAGQAIRQAPRGLAPTVHGYVGWALECALRMLHLLNRRYAPGFKWLWRSATELPDQPEGFQELIELLCEKTDCDFVEDDLNRLVEILGEATNQSGLIQPIRVDLNAESSLGPFYHYTSAFCYALDETLPEGLRGYPHDGPVDLKPPWERLRSARVVDARAE